MKPDLSLSDTDIITELLKDVSAEDARKHPRGRHGRPSTNLNLRSFMAGYGLAFLRASTPGVTDSPVTTRCPSCGASPVRYGVNYGSYSHDPSYLVCNQCGVRLSPKPVVTGEDLPKYSETSESGWLIEATSAIGQCLWWGRDRLRTQGGQGSPSPQGY